LRYSYSQHQKKRALTAEKGLALNMLDSGYNHDHSATATASTDQSAEIKARDTQEINHAVMDLFAISMVSDYT
jgi:uridylate kinase